MRILVCGGRKFTDRPAIDRLLSRVCKDFGGGKHVFIHGASKGADRCSASWAGFNCHDVLSFPADWDEYGLGAGPIRNQQMLIEGKPDIVVAFPGGNGTADMVNRAERAGLRVIKP